MADVRGSRLLADLDNAFKKDPSIDEYDIIPVLEPKHNRSPFILQDHKLGVESWAVKILLRYSAQRLNAWRSHKSGEQFTDSLEVCCLSRAVLLFSPEVYTAWNIRKELIERGYISVCEDLMFGALVLSKHPNSPETYVHRRWLFQYLLNDSLCDSSGTTAGSNSCGVVNVDSIDVDMCTSVQVGVCESESLVLESNRLLRSHAQRELKLCDLAAEHYACNYHAWSHRIWVMQHCLNCSVGALLSELKVSESWTSQHISDHSGFHYRQFLLSELHNRRSELDLTHLHSSTQLLMLEMSHICDLIHSFPGHETLWYHRRFVFQTLLQSDHLEVKLQKNAYNGHIPGSEQSQARDLETFRSLCVSQEIDNVTSKELCGYDGYQQVLRHKYIQWLRTL